MDTATMTLTDFLLARIVEDEAIARAASAHDALDSRFGPVEYQWLRLYHRTYKHRVRSSTNQRGAPPPARVLAECEAKRGILDEHSRYESQFGDGCVVCDGDNPGAGYPCQTVGFLALPYADHPGYQGKWRP